jgi:3-oxoacyl-[acyl-carrier-protein] synthase II
MENVVITGIGLASALGHDIETFWANLLAGKSGVSNIERVDTEKYAVKFGAEIKEYDHSPYFSDRDAKRTSRNIIYGVGASKQALEMAGLNDTNFDPLRAGIIVGSGMGGMEIFHDNSAALANKGPRRVSPFFIPMAIPNMVAGEISIQTGFMGPNWSIVSACATSNHSFISAADQIRLGRADVMLAGGAEEAVCPSALGGFGAMKALSTRNEDPTAASRPFDKNRDGFVLGEGAGILVLESETHAKARGAKILGRLMGYAATGDAYHMSAPREDGKGVKAAMNGALADANLSLADIKYINTHGTSTPLGDVAEAGAIQSLFGSDGVKINSTKSMTGHALGAASGIEAVVALMSLRDQKLHPTINLDEQDERIELDCCASKAVDLEMEFAMSNSFGFGGHNSSLIFGKA